MHRYWYDPILRIPIIFENMKILKFAKKRYKRIAVVNYNISACLFSMNWLFTQVNTCCLSSCTIFISLMNLVSEIDSKERSRQIDVTIAPSLCSYHGQYLTGVCKCEHGWTGRTCEISKNEIGFLLHNFLVCHLKFFFRCLFIMYHGICHENGSFKIKILRMIILLMVLITITVRYEVLFQVHPRYFSVWAFLLGMTQCKAIPIIHSLTKDLRNIL
uniref:EGF-like domain-containing protein n=1 Tax=Heterorhabditis bacteriophora TaxID=37862 RepID=A0A1I7WA25_HETBA